MDLVFWKEVSTVMAFIAFIAVAWWAYNPKNRKRFEDDGMIVINTDPILSEEKKTNEPANLDESNREKP